MRGATSDQIAAAVLAAIVYYLCRGAATRDRLLIAGLAFASYPVQTAVFVGQMGVHVAAFAASGTSLVLSGSRFGWLGTGGSVARVFRTVDAGASWSAAPSGIPPRAGTGGVFSVAFTGERHGVVGGGDYERADSSRGTAAFTTDSGMTWTPAAAFPRGAAGSPRAPERTR